MHAHVVTTEWLTPALVRVVLGGDGLDRLRDARGHRRLRERGDPARRGGLRRGVRPRRRSGSSTPKEHWPRRRRYTVRSWDARRQLLTLDFVVHGSDGVGGPWAAAAQPGDILVFEGPGSGYRPDPSADWHLLVGDESALPAIAVALEAVAPGSPVVVRLVCDGPEHEIPLSSPGVLDVEWLHRTGGPGDADLLPDAVRALEFPRRAGARVRARRGRRDPGDQAAPAARARPDPSGDVVLAVLAPHDDRRVVARGQAPVRRRDGRRRRGGLGRTPGRYCRTAWKR